MGIYGNTVGFNKFFLWVCKLLDMPALRRITVIVFFNDVGLVGIFCSMFGL